MHLKLLSGVLVSFCFLPYTTNGQTPDWLAGVAKVTTKNTQDLAPGTAIVVAIRDGSAILVTGSHVIAGDNRPKIEFVAAPAKAWTASIEATNYEDNVRGLAILRVENPPPGLRALAPGTVSQGTRVSVGGFPAPAARFTMLEPNIARIEGFDLILTQETGKGFSGGPVIYEGRVAGVVFGLDPGQGKAIKSATVREYLDGYGIAWGSDVLQPTPPSESKPPAGRSPIQRKPTEDTSAASDSSKVFKGPYFSFNYPADWSLETKDRIVSIRSPLGPQGIITLDFTPQPPSLSISQYLQEYEERHRAVAQTVGVNVRVKREQRGVGPYTGYAVLTAWDHNGGSSVTETMLVPVGQCYIAAGISTNARALSKAHEISQTILAQILGHLSTVPQCQGNR